MLFLLKVFSKKSIITKLYLCFRILIFPRAFLYKLSSFIEKDSRVLDLWCGYGIVSLYIQFLGLKNDVFGLDIDKKRISNLQSIAKSCKFSNLHFQLRDFITQWFDWLQWYDIAILVDFLHHLDCKTQNSFITYLSKNISTLVIKDIDTKPKYKYYWNLFHDKVIMQNKILSFQWSKHFKQLLISLWYTVTYQKIPSIFPYPHFLLIAKK